MGLRDLLGLPRSWRADEQREEERLREAAEDARRPRSSRLRTVCRRAAELNARPCEES
jgi:hypothetical protein